MCKFASSTERLMLRAELRGDYFEHDKFELTQTLLTTPVTFEIELLSKHELEALHPKYILFWKATVPTDTLIKFCRNNFIFIIPLHSHKSTATASTNQNYR